MTLITGATAGIGPTIIATLTDDGVVESVGGRSRHKFDGTAAARARRGIASGPPPQPQALMGPPLKVRGIWFQPNDGRFKALFDLGGGTLGLFARHVDDLVAIAGEDGQPLDAQAVTARKAALPRQRGLSSDGCAITLFVLMQRAANAVPDAFEALGLGNVSRMITTA